MKLAYITSYDAHDVHNWSGCAHFIAKALEDQAISVDYIGPLRDELRPWAMAKWLMYRLQGKRYLRERDERIVAGYARQATAALRTSNPDVILSPQTVCLAMLQVDRPLVIWSDATFADLVDFYPIMSRLSPSTLRSGHAMEAAALARCTLAIYSSEWAAETAVRHYGVDRQKVRVVPFGANMPGSRTLEEVRTWVAARSRARCQVLFLGVDWHRKGGDTALEAVRLLNERGVKTELIIVGCAPPSDLSLPDFVRVEGRISKRTAEGCERLERLISESHFLLLPTRADCTPVVIAEANAFGVPCVASDVGGVASMIRNGCNGHVVAPTAGPSGYADTIAKAWLDEGEYTHLALSSYEEFRTRLNWQSAGKAVRGLLEDVIRGHQRAAVPRST